MKTTTEETRPGQTLAVDCGSCAVRGRACADCVVSVLLGPPDQEVTFNGDEQQAVEALAEVGILPPLRLVPSRHGSGVLRAANS